jgi:hypothetical protein
MKHIISIFLLVIFSISATQFANGQNRNERKKERKEQKELEQQRIAEIIADTSFLLNATRIYNRNNESFIPQSTGNLMLVHKDTLIIQTSNPTDIGLNGIGGYTALCEILDYEVNKNKKGDISVRIQMASAILGNGTVYFNFTSKNNASARFQGAFGQRFSFRGDLIEPSESDVFIGNWSF